MTKIPIYSIIPRRATRIFFTKLTTKSYISINNNWPRGMRAVKTEINGGSASGPNAPQSVKRRGKVSN